MSYLVTVIIPTYNAKDFIDEAINSIKKQTLGFENIELIIVDDNSTDSTRTLVKEYSQKYTNIKCYFPEGSSGSPSRGRNIGIENASSDYIMFLDQDDRYANTICEVLYNTISSSKADLVMCRHKLIRNNDFSEDSNIDSVDKTYRIYNPTENNDVFLEFLIWDKIYSKQFLNEYNIKFPEGYFMEDVYFCIKSYLNTEKLAFLENYYGYDNNVRDDGNNPSTSNNVTKKLYLNSIEAFYLSIDLLKNENRQDLINVMMKEIFILLIGWFCRLDEGYNSKLSILEEINKLREYCNFNEKLDETWANIIFDNIKKRNYKIAIMQAKVINILFNSYTLRKIYRKIYGRLQN